ncbi:MAG: GNAT family N-acetyltransferase [Brevefilum sp.]
MKHTSKFSSSITTRPAQPTDARPVSQLIFDTFPKMATYVFGLGNATRAVMLFETLFSLKGHRFSYQHTEIITSGNRILGMFIAYPGKTLLGLNWRTARVLLKKYTFGEKFQLITRALPILFIQEAARNEFLLSNLAVKKGQRGQGIGTQILGYVEAKAHCAGYQKLALLVTMDNQQAREFYERHGFRVRAAHLESNRRIKHLGPGYLRMVKEIKQ